MEKKNSFWIWVWKILECLIVLGCIYLFGVAWNAYKTEKIIDNIKDTPGVVVVTTGAIVTGDLIKIPEDIREYMDYIMENGEAGVDFFVATPTNQPNMNSSEAEKENLQREKTFNGMTAHERTLSSRSVRNDLSSARKKSHLQHGATYPEKLCDRVISMYSKKGDVVLDPFLGTGTTVISAVRNGRIGYGIELSPEYFSVSKQNISDSINLLTETPYEIFNGDCEEVIDKLEDNSLQLTLTSPPYADLIHKVVEDREKRHKHSAFVEDNNATTKVYSDSENDLGNMAMEQYKEKVTRIMKKLFKKTRPGGYNIWVVKDFRDVKNKIPYVDLHSAIAECGGNAGFVYHDLIIRDQNEQRSLVLLGYPSVFYVNQNHSYLVVMRKPK